MPMRRRPLRLVAHDYSSAGAYFVTVCAAERACLFGAVRAEQMSMSAAGEAVDRVWHGLTERFPLVALDAFVVMPNHVHGIVVILGDGETEASWTEATGEAYAPSNGGSGFAAPISAGNAPGGLSGAASSAPTRDARAGAERPSLGQIMRVFKSLSAREVNSALGRSGTAVWQRGYYERVIRDERELRAVRGYIADNPVKWDLDPENPSARARDPKEHRDS